MVRLCRAAMVQWFQELGTDSRGARVEPNGVSYRFVDYRSKTLHGLFGTVPYQRADYASGPGWAPLDERVGIKRGHTPGCEYFLSQFGARQAHAESLRQFHEVFRADGGDLLSEKKGYTCWKPASPPRATGSTRSAALPVKPRSTHSTCAWPPATSASARGWRSNIEGPTGRFVIWQQAAPPAPPVARSPS